MSVRPLITQKWPYSIFTFVFSSNYAYRSFDYNFFQQERAGPILKQFAHKRILTNLYTLTMIHQKKKPYQTFAGCFTETNKMKLKEKEKNSMTMPFNVVVENFLENCTSSATHLQNHNKDKQHKGAQASSPWSEDYKYEETQIACSRWWITAQWICGKNTLLKKSRAP